MLIVTVRDEFSSKISLAKAENHQNLNVVTIEFKLLRAQKLLVESIRQTA